LGIEDMPVIFSAYVVDKFIAPGASTFAQAEIPDMSNWAKESPHWVANFFLYSAFSQAFLPPMNAYAYNFLRRAQYAFSEHHLARDATLAFLSGGRQSPRRYVDALFHWETFLGQSWHAFAILIAALEGRAFEKNDGSIEQRLNALYNQMKHVESRIDHGQMMPGATVSVWLENEGLRSIDVVLTFAETAVILKQIALYADALSNPQTAKEGLARIDAQQRVPAGGHQRPSSAGSRG
jgi:hypothetical protein